MSGYKVKPKGEKDAKLARVHLKDSVKYNMAHAKDHMKEAKKAQKMLQKSGKYLKGY